MNGRAVRAVVMVLSLSTSAAWAQTADAPTAATEQPDGGRMRWGVSAAAGLESVADTVGGSASGMMYGLDVRLGYQISNLLALYVPLHLSFGSLATSGGASGLTGTFAGTVVAEATFIDRVFAGIGGGWGMLNNPAGPTLHIRAGGYPLMSRSSTGPGRGGLVLAVDYRSIFVTGGTGTLILGSVGYEGF